MQQLSCVCALLSLYDWCIYVHMYMSRVMAANLHFRPAASAPSAHLLRLTADVQACHVQAAENRPVTVILSRFRVDTSPSASLPCVEARALCSDRSCWL